MAPKEPTCLGPENFWERSRLGEYTSDSCIQKQVSMPPPPLTAA